MSQRKRIIPKLELKYLQDMTKDDFEKVFVVGLTDKLRESITSNFNSLYGWATSIGRYGEFHSWDTAKELGYDVNFTMPIKK